MRARCACGAIPTRPSTRPSPGTVPQGPQLAHVHGALRAHKHPQHVVQTSFFGRANSEQYPFFPHPLYAAVAC